MLKLSIVLYETSTFYDKTISCRYISFMPFNSCHMIFRFLPPLPPPPLFQFLPTCLPISRAAKPKIPFLCLSLLWNQTETLATQAKFIIAVLIKVEYLSITETLLQYTLLEVNLIGRKSKNSVTRLKTICRTVGWITFVSLPESKQNLSLIFSCTDLITPLSYRGWKSLNLKWIISKYCQKSFIKCLRTFNLI